MAYTATIRRWIGNDIDKFCCSPCGTFLNPPSKVAPRAPAEGCGTSGKILNEKRKMNSTDRHLSASGLAQFGMRI
jgi:hypothetical protein